MKNPTKEATLEPVNTRFNEELDKFKSGALRSSEVLHLGAPLEILQAAGLKRGEITITQRTLADHLKAHNLTAEDLKGLAKAIQKPLLIYRWGKKHPSTAIVTEITVADGRKVAIGIRLESKGNDLSVNEIATIHGKTDNKLLDDLKKTTPEELQNEKLRWVEKEKVLGWLGMAPPKGATLTDPKLLDIAKVIKNFQNPKLSGENSHISDRWTGKKLGIRELALEKIATLTFAQAVKGAVADLSGGKKIPTKIGEVELSADQRDNLAKGNTIEILNLTDKFGKKHTSTVVQWDDKKNTIVLASNTKAIIKQKQPNRPNHMRGMKM
jgi:hypothetical protein